MGDLSNLIGSVVETVAKYNRATVKPYQKIKHVMTKDNEILVPSDVEEYTFRLNEGWKITSQDKIYLTIRREVDDKK